MVIGPLMSTKQISCAPLHQQRIWPVEHMDTDCLALAQADRKADERLFWDRENWTIALTLLAKISANEYLKIPLITVCKNWLLPNQITDQDTPQSLSLRSQYPWPMAAFDRGKTFVQPFVSFFKAFKLTDHSLSLPNYISWDFGVCCF